MKSYINIELDLMSKLNNSLKSFKNELISVSNRIEEISQIFDLLEILSEKSSNHVIISHSFKIISFHWKSWKETIDNQINFVKTHYIDFFKYIREEYSCFQDVI